MELIDYNKIDPTLIDIFVADEIEKELLQNNRVYLLTFAG